MATAAETAFNAAIRERLAARAALLKDAGGEAIAALQTAQADILSRLAAQPSDYQQWLLRQLLEQIRTALDAATGRAAARTDANLQAAWQQGEGLIDQALAAADLQLGARMPLLDVTVLGQLRSFTTDRIRDIGVQALSSINRTLGLVTLGARTGFEAMQQVNATLGGESQRRALTIVRTELGRAFAMSSDARLTQAAAVLPGQLQKQWRRSGKLHSRWNHDAMDGVRVDAGAVFDVPNPDGGTDPMRHPHDPAAPLGQNINCGCIALPRVKGWSVMPPRAPGRSPTSKPGSTRGRRGRIRSCCARCERRRRRRGMKKGPGCGPWKSGFCAIRQNGR